jgi:hypothetical protein
MPFTDSLGFFLFRALERYEEIRKEIKLGAYMNHCESFWPIKMKASFKM